MFKLIRSLTRFVGHQENASMLMRGVVRGGCVIRQPGLSESEGRTETQSFTDFVFPSLLSACVSEPPGCFDELNWIGSDQIGPSAQHVFAVNVAFASLHLSEVLHS